MFEKKSTVKPVFVPKKEEPKKEESKKPKCKYHKVFDRHCVDCNKKV